MARVRLATGMVIAALSMIANYGEAAGFTFPWFDSRQAPAPITASPGGCLWADYEPQTVCSRYRKSIGSCLGCSKVENKPCTCDGGIAYASNTAQTSEHQRAVIHAGPPANGAPSNDIERAYSVIPESVDPPSLDPLPIGASDSTAPVPPEPRDDSLLPQNAVPTADTRRSPPPENSLPQHKLPTNPLPAIESPSDSLPKNQLPEIFPKNDLPGAMTPRKIRSSGRRISRTTRAARPLELRPATMFPNTQRLDRADIDLAKRSLKEWKQQVNK